MDRLSFSAQNQVSEFSETFLFLCKIAPPSTCGKILRISSISAALAVATTVWIASGEKKFRLFLFFYCRLSEVVKNLGLLCRKVTLNCFLLCHFGIGCLQRGFMKRCSMMTWTAPRTTTLATMIRHTIMMIMRRIFDLQLYKFSRQHNLRIEIIANFVEVKRIFNNTKQKL